MRPPVVLMGSLLFSATIFGWDTAHFSFQHALLAVSVVTVITGVVLTGFVLLPGVALWGGATMIGTACAIGLCSLICGVLAGAAYGLQKGDAQFREQVERRREERVNEIFSISNRIDIYFEPRSENPDEAKDFVCWFVTYDETKPESPETSERIAGRDADEFYDRCRDYLDRWLTMRLGRDDRARDYELHVFTDHPFPGDGTYTRIESIADQMQLETKRHDAKWMSAVHYLEPATQ
jgi:hypothetical protein